jgi:hypothetical protein
MRSPRGRRADNSGNCRAIGIDQPREPGLDLPDKRIRRRRSQYGLVEAVAALPAPERLQARVGIATGLVVVGDLAGASPEHEVVGEAPNLAARLRTLARTRQCPDREHDAPPGRR